MAESMLRRFWILIRTELLAWRRDPITALGGVIPPTLILAAFGLLFGGKLLFRIAVVNHDQGNYGEILVQTIEDVKSPFGIPYYEIVTEEDGEAWESYREFRIEGVWLIPDDFSERIESGADPQIEMYFNNYNDDRAKNHRIYSSEILWSFYTRIGMSDSPVVLEEVYPAETMVDWFPIIAVGVVLMAAMLGGIFNMYALTYKETRAGLLKEAALMTVPIGVYLAAKTVLALVFSLVTGMIMLAAVSLWLGSSLFHHMGLVLFLMALVAVFWVSAALFIGMTSRRYMAGAVGVALTGIMVFFVGGGLSMVRVNRDKVLAAAWLFPNTYVVDPLRDLVLFNQIPVDLTRVIVIAAVLAVSITVLCWLAAGRMIRRSAV